MKILNIIEYVYSYFFIYISILNIIKFKTNPNKLNTKYKVYDNFVLKVKNVLI